MATGRKNHSSSWDLPSALQLSAIHGIEVHHLIGFGGMGAVYQARQINENRSVALKVARRSADLSRDFKSFLIHEAHVIAELNHKNIVKVYDFGSNDELVWIIMEFVNGPTVRDLILARQMKPDQALLLSLQLCDGLKHAHSRGVIHNDLKPENVMVDGDGQAKIIDFGLSRVRSYSYTIARPGKAIGTRHYMAPEQRANRPNDIDHRSDIYSLGVIMWEMLTGKVPTGPFSLPSGQCNGPWHEIVQKCLSHNLENRWQSCAELFSAMCMVTYLDLESSLGINSMNQASISSSTSSVGI
jgi:eukaryotic-like serine/threonine-protein kinase